MAKSKKRSQSQPQPKPLIVVEEGADYRILFDREAKDYAVEVNGQPVGWRADLFAARRLVEDVREGKA